MKYWKTKSGYQIIQIISGRSNVFLLSDGRNNILIDTSVTRVWPKIQKQLAKLGINTVNFLILTHAHFDHAANAYRIKEKYKAKVMIHKDEAGYLSKGENILPEGTIFLTRLMMNAFGKRMFSIFKYMPCIPDFLVNNKHDLAESGFNAYLIHTPGHTMGSMSLIVDDEIAIVGDAMFGVFKGTVFPPFAQDKKQMIRSWEILLDTKCSIFLPSHGTANTRLLVQKDYSKRIKT